MMKKVMLVVLLMVIVPIVSAQQRMCGGNYSFPNDVQITKNLYATTVVGTNFSAISLIGAIEFMTNNAFGMIIDAAGNVGVGTRAPTQKLDVNGGIKATQLCIGSDCKTAWPAQQAGGITQEVDPTVQAWAKTSSPTIPGSLTVAGAVTTSGHSFVVEQVIANCNSATCTASCPSGKTIIQAFGFHGISATREIGIAIWGCGTGIEWAGQCLGSSSCTISTGCSSSSIQLLCT